MKADPPIPESGCCAVCGKPHRPERSKRYAGLHAYFDPYCSNICARADHNNPMPHSSIWGNGTASLGTGRQKAA